MIKIKFKNTFQLLCYGLLFFCFPAQAGVSYGVTRIIFKAPQYQVSLPIVNADDYSVLVQSWSNTGNFDTNPQQDKTPFIVIPPMFKLEGKQQMMLRLIYDGTPLPQDRESMFWLNVYEIPAIPNNFSGTQYLRMATRTQLKIFYRPKNIEMPLDEVAKKLTFSLRQNSDDQWILYCENNSPINASFSGIFIDEDKEKIQILNTLQMTAPPFGHITFVLNKKPKQDQGNVYFNLIGDDGYSKDFTSKIK